MCVRVYMCGTAYVVSGVQISPSIKKQCRNIEVTFLAAEVERSLFELMHTHTHSYTYIVSLQHTNTHTYTHISTVLTICCKLCDTYDNLYVYVRGRV